MIIVYNIERNIPYLQIHSPRHQNHNHTRKNKYETRKKGVAKQLLEFFFYEKLYHIQ